jgi:hypothetical protein
MIARGVIGVLIAASVTFTAAATAQAQDDTRHALARELSRLLIDDSVRNDLNEQVGSRVMHGVATELQDRLNRRLLDVEWRLLAQIVGRFMKDTLPPARTEEIAMEIYMKHFDEDELRELVRFQRSAVGRKAARLTRVIAADTIRAISEEIRSSPATPEMLAELRRAFPVLGTFQSP